MKLSLLRDDDKGSPLFTTTISDWPDKSEVDEAAKGMDEALQNLSDSLQEQIKTNQAQLDAERELLAPAGATTATTTSGATATKKNG